MNSFLLARFLSQILLWAFSSLSIQTLCPSCLAGGQWGRSKAHCTGSLCWRWPACHERKLCFCPCFRCCVSSSARWTSGGSAGIHGLSAGLWSSGQQPGVSCCRWRRKTAIDGLFLTRMSEEVFSEPGEKIQFLFPCWWLSVSNPVLSGSAVLTRICVRDIVLLCFRKLFS